MKRLTFCTAIPALSLGIVLGVFSAPVFSQPFELDGNATSDGGIDWNLVNSGSPPAGIVASTGLIVDRPEPIFP